MDGLISPPVVKEVHAVMSVLNCSVKKSGTGVDVNVGTGVNVWVGVAVGGGV